VIRRVFKYPTGAVIPEGAIYLCSIKNGRMSEKEIPSGLSGCPSDYMYVWHYFLVEVKT
jgi:hypothetical protein